MSLPAISRGMSREHYVTLLGRIVRRCEPALLLIDEPSAGLITDGGIPIRVRPIERLDGDGLADPEFPDPHTDVFVQYSSGSTTEPRGCMLSGMAIARQLSMLEDALRLDPDTDVKVDWLPLSHDMGLFGCLLLTAYWTGVRQVLSTPQRFLASPQSWFRDCAQFGATITCGPNFALELTARVAKRLPADPIPLTRVVVGSDRVDPGTLDRVCAALGAERLQRRALMPAYGLAEATLAVTMTPTGTGPKVIEVEQDALGNGIVRETDQSETPGAPDSAFITSAGPALPGNDVEIIGDADIGEVRVRSLSLASGYLGAPQLTAERFTADGLLTGDLGFKLGDHLYITGRADDLMIIGGRNIYASDIETAVMSAGLVRPGNCAVVQADADLKESLVVLAEPREHGSSFASIAEQIAAVAYAAAGVRVSECVFVPSGVFPKTPSGKVQRFRCQEISSDRTFTLAERISVDPALLHRRAKQP